MTSLRAIIYCRVSSKEQTLNLSLPVQEDQCRTLCSQNGWEVEKVFMERGSAKTADRTELQAALTYLREQNKRSERIHVFVVTNVDRFARDSFDHAIIRRHLAGLGVTLRSVSQPIDETPAGKFMEGIFAALSQLDNEVRGCRTKAGMQEALRRGQWVWKPPLGYLLDGKTLQPDPERAPLVRLGFERFATGLYTRAQVLEDLTTRGLRTRKGRELTPQRWGELLSNRFYIARIYQAGWDIDTAGNWPPLVEEDVFWRCRSLLRTDGLIVAKERNNPDFPLRGFVTCGHCRKPLTASWSQGKTRRHAYYHCPSKAHCRRTNIPRQELEACFLGLLENLRPRPELLALFRRIVLDVWETRRQDIAAQRAAAERNLAELKRRKDQLLEAFVYEKAIDQQTYKDQLDKLNEGLALAELEQHGQRFEELDVEAVLAFAERVSLNASRMWLEANLDQRQRFQSLLFPEVCKSKKERFELP
ncbi:MAG TPA: recombinase family protein [Thermoanaerobaculia bacterium]|jgi:DNA invertase Pin-like site-specific DNA recombinase|nr:recombinase family protein [Thermoanaerobaculia bacterium]